MVPVGYLAVHKRRSRKVIGRALVVCLRSYDPAQLRSPMKPATDSTLKPATRNALKPAGRGALESAATCSGITPRRRPRIGGHGAGRRRDWQASARSSQSQPQASHPIPVARGGAEEHLLNARRLFLPRLGLDQNPKDHQMRNNDERGVERINVPKGGEVVAGYVQLDDATHSV